MEHARNTMKISNAKETTMLKQQIVKLIHGITNCKTQLKKRKDECNRIKISYNKYRASQNLNNNIYINNNSINNNHHQDDPFTTPQNTPHKNTNNSNTNNTNTNNSNTNSSNNSNRSSNRSVNNLRARSNVGNFGSSVKKKRNGISKGDRFLRTTQRLSKNNSSSNNSSSNHNVGDSSKKAKRERLKIRKFFKKIKKL